MLQEQYTGFRPSENDDWTLTVRVVNIGKIGAFSFGLYGGATNLFFELNPAKVLGQEVTGLEGASMHLKIPAKFIHIQRNRLVSEWREIAKSAKLVEFMPSQKKVRLNSKKNTKIYY